MWLIQRARVYWLYSGNTYVQNVYCKQRCINRFWRGHSAQTGHPLDTCCGEGRKQPLRGVPTAAWIFRCIQPRVSQITTGQHSSQPLALHMAQYEPVMTNCCRKKGREVGWSRKFFNYRVSRNYPRKCSQLRVITRNYEGSKCTQK